jgi:hypothetical protein
MGQPILVVNHYEEGFPVKRLFLILAVLLPLSLGCRYTGFEPGTPSQTSPPPPLISTEPVDTSGPQPFSTETAAPNLASPIPTHTALAAPVTATQTPGVTTILPRDLDPEDPWLLMQSAGGLYAVNADGSGLTLLTDETHIDLKQSLSPDQNHLAYISMMVPQDYSSLELFTFDLRARQGERITSLLPQNIQRPIDPEHSLFEAARAIYDFSPPVWSPDGRLLAFMGAQDGPSSDLYIYNRDTGRITRLTDGPSEGYAPSWSPDGRWILHFGADNFGTGAGFTLRGVWAASADGRDVKTLYRPSSSSANESTAGWIDDQTVLILSWDMFCGAKNLRAINIATLAENVLWPRYFDEHSLAFDAQSGKIVLTAVPGCDETAEGTYLLSGALSPQQLTPTEGFATWSPEAGLFVIRQADTVRAFTPEGEEVNLGPVPAPSAPAASPGGARWAWASSRWSGGAGLYITTSSGSSQRITAEETTWASWTPDGESLFFGDTNGQLFFASAPSFVPMLIGEGLQVQQPAVWVLP